MKKIVVIIICLATIVGLFGVNNATKTFSFEDYITKVSVSAENRPDMPSTEKIQKVFLEYEFSKEDKENSAKILVVVKSIWTTIKLIYECIVFAVMFLLYLVEMLLYLINILSAMTYNLLVW